MDDAELQKERILYRLASTSFMGTLEEKTGVPRKKLAFFTLLSVGLFSIFIFGVQTFSQVAAFCYPAYKTFKVLQKSHHLTHEESDEVDDSGYDRGEQNEKEQEKEKEKEENIHNKKEEEEKEREHHLIDQYVLWLSYWVVYGFF